MTAGSSVICAEDTHTHTGHELQRLHFICILTRPRVHRGTIQSPQMELCATRPARDSQSMFPSCLKVRVAAVTSINEGGGGVLQQAWIDRRGLTMSSLDVAGHCVLVGRKMMDEPLQSSHAQILA